MAYTQQPGAQPGMVAAGNRNVKNLPVGADGRDWSNGLCGCCGDAGTCGFRIFLIFWRANTHDINSHRYRRVLLPMHRLRQG